MKNISHYLILGIIILVNLIFVPSSFAQPHKIAIKEISVFKDGHVFVLHEGALPTDSNGNVLVDYLPTPILGTFWPYSAETNAKLAGVTVGRKKIAVERTALNLEALLAANIGAEVLITEKPLTTTVSERYLATIIGIPTRSSAELALTSPNDVEQLPQKSDMVMLRTSNGTKALPISQIQDLTFKNAFKGALTEEEFRNQMTLKLDWSKPKSPNTMAQVGLVYLQKGIRWIPDYKITLDGNGNAAIKLQATLLNELTDLEDVTTNLVVGVPTFAFKDIIDPIALQQAGAQLSRYFENSQGRSNNLSNNISINGTDNDISSQRVIRSQEIDPSTQPSGDLGPEIPNAGQTEDLFIFTLKHISLKKGERMVFTLSEQTLKYKDIYTIDIPFSPPSELAREINSQQQLEIARLLKTPKAIHKIRLNNTTSSPFTTAPALLIRDNMVLAQGMLTYTAIGATTDLEITKAINILAKKTDTETKRIPNAVRWEGSDYSRVELASSLNLTNLYKQPVYLEINRYVLGSVENASNNGEIKNLNILEDDSFLSVGSLSNNYAYNWPSWWSHFNGVGKVSWKVTLEPGKSINYDYSWHYFSR